MNSEQDERNIETGEGDGAITSVEEATPPAPERRTTTTPARAKLDADTYAVGVHVMRLAPAWLLTTSVCFVLLLLMLSWVRPGANASGETLSAPNDSKAAPPHVSTALNTASQPKVVAAKESDAAQPASTTSQASATSTTDVTPTTDATSTSNEATTQAAPVGSSPASFASQTDAAQGASTDASASPVQQFTVQAGSHTDESSANEQVSAMRAAGFDARAVAVELQGRGRWFRVQSGRFSDRAGASKEAARIRARGLAPSAIVVPAQD